MKKYFSLIIFLLYNSVLSANTNIVYLDMDKVVSTSDVGKSILIQLDATNSKILKILEQTSTELKKKEKKLFAQKNLLSISEYEKKIITLKSEINAYEIRRNKEIKKLNLLKENNINIFLKQINKIIVKYSEEKKILLILQKKNIIIGKANLDVSNDIIKLINLNIKEFEVK